MSDNQIFSALSVPTVAPQPSITCVQWSGDGQLIFTTRSAIFILTPGLGINFDNLSLLRTSSVIRNGKDGKDGSVDLGWYRNLIEFERTVQHQWPAETKEWGALALGSLDISWRSVTMSPSDLTPTSGCLLVTMNTNMELSLWHSGKNHLKEAWTKIQDITSALRELPLPQNEDGIPQEQCAYLRTLQAQVNCLSWSQQAYFGLNPNPLVDGSILALGTRAGSIIMMRYDGTQSVNSIKVMRISDEWITHLAWGVWKPISAFQSEAYLSCGMSDGCILLIRVRQKISQQQVLTPFGSNMTIQCEFDQLDLKCSEPDGRGITALSWVEDPYSMPTLVHAKPGIVHFYRLQSTDPPRGAELPSLRLQTQKLSVCSSSLSPVVGVSGVNGLDTVILTLFDGSFHVVQHISTQPTLHNADSMEVDEGNVSILSSSNLSRLAREIFVKVEGNVMQLSDVCRISGAASFDRSGTMVWLHEACRPTDFSYKHDAKHNSMLVVARVWKDPDSTNTLKQFEKVLKCPKSVLGHAPVHILRPLFLHLSERRNFENMWLDVLQLLIWKDDEDSHPELGPWTGVVDTVTRKELRHSLAIDFYGWDSFLSLRLRLAIADFCWKMALTDDTRENFGQVAQTLLNAVSHRFLTSLMKHLTVMIGSLTEPDIPFLMRVIVQSLLSGSPQSLSEKANELNEVAKQKFPSSPDVFNLSEPCPACHAPIPLENLLNAVCPQGHVWARCSITSFLLSTPSVRTCIGCTRKAFLAPSSRGTDDVGSLMWIPEAGRSWIVDELLEAARCCLYCGNRFVRML